MIEKVQWFYNSNVDRVITAMFLSFLCVGVFCLARIILADIEERRESCEKKQRIKKLKRIFK